MPWNTADLRSEFAVGRVSEWLAATLEMWCPRKGVAGSSPVPSASEDVTLLGVTTRKFRTGHRLWRPVSVIVPCKLVSTGTRRRQAEWHHSWHLSEKLGAIVGTFSVAELGKFLADLRQASKMPEPVFARPSIG